MAVVALYSLDVTVSNFNNLPYMQNGEVAFQIGILPLRGKEEASK
jgi:hypothetical protein